jgi:hypothetical protein
MNGCPAACVRDEIGPIRRDPLMWSLTQLQGAVADALGPERHIASELLYTASCMCWAMLLGV